MLHTFQARYSAAAAALLGEEERKKLVQRVVTEAERLRLGRKKYAIFGIAELDLTAVVRFARKEVHIMTTEEAASIGLPKGE